jgi:hypothetical protein
MTNKNKIKGDFNFIVPTIVPSFVRGKDAETLCNQVSKTIKSGVWYDKDSKTMKGSSTFLAARVDGLVRKLGNGIRVAALADLSKPEIMEMIKGNYYSDTPAIVFRTIEDSYEPNSLLIKKLAPLCEQKQGKLQLPLIVTGFDVVPSKDRAGYGFDIVPTKQFNVRYDEKLLGKYNGENFSNIDENGLPNFDKKGSRTWYARDKGLSRLYLYGDLDLYSGYAGVGLAGSNVDGRVVLVRDGVAGAEKRQNKR